MAINLKKGGQINLTKSNGQRIEFVCAGLNWGQIRKKSFFGLLSDDEAVDLDGSAALFDAGGQWIETVYFKRLASGDGAVKHSGDDLSGDVKDDNRDNEVITIDFEKLNKKVQSVVLFLNSYKGQDFATIPYAKVRIYEGIPGKVETMYASFDLAADPQYAGYVSMIMGKFIKAGEGWRFQAIGEAVKAPNVAQTIEAIQKQFL